jgi:hypothetical protein
VEKLQTEVDPLSKENELLKSKNEELKRLLTEMDDSIKHQQVSDPDLCFNNSSFRKLFLNWWRVIP